MDNYVDFLGTDTSLLPCGSLTVFDVDLKSEPELGEGNIIVNVDGSIDSPSSLDFLPDYAVALAVDFRIKFEDAPTFDEPSEHVRTARFTLGDIQWVDAPDYSTMILYAYGSKEIMIEFPKLQGG